MATFTSLIGKRVEVNYRAGDIRMTATGTLAIDSGEFIRIEDRFSHSGREKTVRLEIPYPSLVRVRRIFLDTEHSSPL
ncbi:MAG TPA: hypothetical protein VJN21_04955 [Candidatus Acidoferrales bacterium]|nr:hypothetical protein [Candidatus Acidoferrales bacterium]